MADVLVDWQMEPRRCSWWRRHVPTHDYVGDFFIRNLSRCGRCGATFTRQYPGTITEVYRRTEDVGVVYTLRSRPTWWSKFKVVVFGDGRD